MGFCWATVEKRLAALHKNRFALHNDADLPFEWRRALMKKQADAGHGFDRAIDEIFCIFCAILAKNRNTDFFARRKIDSATETRSDG